jgi:hypothetical protein
MVQNSSELATMKPGDHLLTITEVNGLELVSIHYPYALYRVPKDVNWRNVGLSYAVSMPGAMFARSSSEDGGVRITGPSTYIPPGTYRAAFRSTTGAGPPLRVEMVGAGNSITLTRMLEPGAEPVISFRTDGLTPLTFRISGPSLSRLPFEGIELIPAS